MHYYVPYEPALDLPAYGLVSQGKSVLLRYALADACMDLIDDAHIGVDGRPDSSSGEFFGPGGAHEVYEKMGELWPRIE